MSYAVAVTSLHRHSGMGFPPGKPESQMSFVLATRWASGQLMESLDYLRHYSDLSNELVIIADCPSWQTVKALDEAELNYHATNFGHYFMACNFGAAIARRPYVGFLQDDTFVGPHWDTALQSLLAEDCIAGLPMLDGTGMADDNWCLLGKWSGIPIRKALHYNRDNRHIDRAKFVQWCRENSEDAVMNALSLPWVMPKDKFLAQPFLCCGPQGWGHEVDCLRCHEMERGMHPRVSLKSYIYHRCTMGASSDMSIAERYQRLCHGFISGVSYCRNCGHIEAGPERSEGDNRYRRSADRGYWLCPSCEP